MQLNTQIARALSVTLALFVGVVMLGADAQAQGSRGDVNGDGVVDIRDALRLYQVVKGAVAPTDRDRNLGDVHPLPGSGGRIIGDGQLTEDDVVRVLRFIVGLVSRGELTGEFEGPFVSEFEPTSGSAGTSVTIRGLNFVSGSTTENVVKLSGTQSKVLSAMATELVVEIPEGANSGPFTVTTPGGTTTSQASFVITTRVAGKLDLLAGGPSGGSPTEFRVLSSYGEAVPNADGNFELQVGDEPSHLVLAIPKSGGENIYVGMYLPDERVGVGGVAGKLQVAGLAIDAYSTAVALLYINPAVFPKADFPHSQFVNLIRSMPETEALARVIAQVYPTNPDPLEDSRVRQALKAAFDSLIVKLPREDVVGFPQGRSSQSEAQVLNVEGGSLHPLDINATWVGLKRKGDLMAYTAGNRWVTPVNWFSRIIKLNPAQFGRGMGDIQNANAYQVYLREQTLHTGVITARGLLNLFANLAVWTRGLVEALGVGWPAGTTSPDKDLDAKEDAVYLVRSFSGAFYVSDSEEGKFLEGLPSGLDDHTTARLSNISDFVVDFLLAVCGVKVDSKVVNVLANVVGAVGKKLSAMKILNRQGAGIADYFNGAEMVAILWEALPDMMDAFLQWVMEGNVVGNEAAEKGKKVVAMLKKTMPVVSQVAGWGRVTERIMGLAGVPPSVVAGVTVTPLETAILVVGDPFSPKIKEYPKTVRAGTEMVIKGSGFSLVAKENEVWVNGNSTQILGVGAQGTELRVRLQPWMSPGSGDLVVKTKRGQAKAPIEVVRLPIIREVTPKIGFAAGGTFKGKAFEGTTVRIFGSFFDTVNDKVFFGGGVEAIVVGSGSPGSELVVRVPQGAKDGTIWVRTQDGFVAESPVTFSVMKAPILSQITSDTARAGTSLILRGEQLPQSSSEVYVQFQFAGQTVTREAAIRSENVLETDMPSEVPEGTQAAVSVVTPAGVSNTMTLRRIKGREIGAELNGVVVSNEVKPDGVLTLAEAVDFAQGKRDPFSVAQGWDDADLDVVIDTARGGRVVSITPRSNRGHTGKEWAYLFWPTGLSAGVEPLDDLSRTSLYGTTLPGMGKVEEGDLVGSDKVGKDFADIVNIQTLGVGDIVLDEPGAGGDQFLVSYQIPDSQRVLQGKIIINTGDNLLDGAYMQIAGTMEVTGSANYIRRLKLPGGLLIKGAKGNELERLSVGTPDTRLPVGVRITDVASANKLVLDTLQNCDVGIEISGGAFGNKVYNPFRVINSGVGVHVWGQGTRGNQIFGTYDKADVGVKISGGAQENLVESEVENNRVDGILIEGNGTDRNVVLGSVSFNDGIGVHIRGGAKSNYIGLGTYAYISGNKGHGVLVEGDGTDETSVRSWFSRLGQHNGKSDIAVIGSGAASPMGTVIENSRFGGGAGEADVLLQNLQKTETGLPSVVIRKCRFENYVDRTHPAIVLDNVRGALLEENTITGTSMKPYPVGILIKGEGTQGNVLNMTEIVSCDLAGVHITDKASGNLIVNVESISSKRFGMLVDGGAFDNKVVYRPELDNALIWGLRKLGGKEAGLMIRGGAKNNWLERYWVFVDDVVIEGMGTSGNTLVRNSLTSVVVRAGATETAIGLGVPGMGNAINGFDVDKPGILVQDAATSKVFIFDNYISFAKKGGIVVVGAQDVRIGSEQGAGNNNFYGNPGGGIRIAGAKGVRIANNIFRGSSLRPQPTGIVVQGASSGVIIGGATRAEGNSIFQNSESGIHIAGADNTDIQIRNNTVGDAEEPSRTGTLLDGGVQGVQVADNSIQFCEQDGIRISGSGTSRNSLVRNVITANKGSGVVVADGAQLNVINDNSIFNNGGFGIALGIGIARNTVLSGSIFANASGGIKADQPLPPKVTSVTSGVVLGEVPPATPNGSLVQVYADASDQGKVFLGSARSFGKDFRLKVAVPEGLFVTATVTDPNGNTSTFGERGESTVKPALTGNQILVFTSTRDGNTEIYSQRAGDISDTRLTNNSAADYSPVFSSDTSKIVFVSERSGNAEIWVMDVDGGNLKRLTNHAARDSDPTWVAGGKKIVFTSERDGNPELYLMGADGSNVLRLTDSPGADRHAAVSPDGKKIAFTSERGGNSDVWIIGIDGSNPMILTSNAARDYDPAWSPDGQRIAFVSERDGNAEIYLMKADGSNLVRLTENAADDVEPVWSLNGEWIAFSLAQAGDVEIWAINVGTKRSVRLTVSLGSNSQPSWGQVSTAGTRMAAASEAVKLH